MAFEENIKKAIRSVENAFIPNELAYLALTQKVEHAFRDKLAFILHRNFENLENEFVVCREWARADLAILEERNPVLIVEAKAGYTFDILMGDRGYNFPALVSKDLEKAARLAARFNLKTTPEIYALVIATHPHTAPDVRFMDAVKYYNKVVRYATLEHNLEDILKAMNKRMNDFDLIDTHCVKGGIAFDVNVSVYVWLYRARLLEEKVKNE